MRRGSGRGDGLDRAPPPGEDGAEYVVQGNVQLQAVSGADRDSE